LRVVADELADLVDQEDDAVTGRFGCQITLDQFGEPFDVDAVGLAGVVEPGGGGFFALLKGFGEGMNDIVAQEIDGIALGIPGRAILVGECRFEGVIGALADQVAFHFGDMRCVTAVAKLFVEDAQEDLQDDVAVRFAVGLGIDIEQDDVRTPCTARWTSASSIASLILCSSKNWAARLVVPSCGFTASMFSSR
jgi:hypothetical protein